MYWFCLLYTSDAADDLLCVDLGADSSCSQAEDGIRDAQESRGLGDVYKRQVRYYILSLGFKIVYVLVR